MPGAAASAGRAARMSMLTSQQTRPCRPFSAVVRRSHAVPAAEIRTVHLGDARQSITLSRARQTRRRRVHLSAVADATATFTVPSQPLAFGEHLRLVGSAEQLGSWDPAAGLALEWAEGDNWSAEAAFPEGAIDFKVVVAKGDGSYHWEELAGDANRTVDVGAGALSVTCHMGGGTEVSSSVGSGGSGGGGQRPSAIDMSVDMDAAKELNPAFGTQAGYDGTEGMEPGAGNASGEAAVESEAADLIEEKIGGQEQVGSTFKAAGPPGDDAAPEADEAAAGEGAPADEEESAQDMVQGQEQVGGTYRAPAPPQQEAAPEAGEAAAGEGAPADEEEAAPQGDEAAAGEGAPADEEEAAAPDTAGGSSGAVAAYAVQGSEVSADNGAGGHAPVTAAKALAQGDGSFLGRHDVQVQADGSITFSLDPADQGVQQMAADILGRLQQ